jgi:ATP-dependent DNA helicase RecG
LPKALPTTKNAVGPFVTEIEFRKYLLAKYPKETDFCEWKEFKSLKGNVTGAAGHDIASYVSAIANVNGGHIVVGVEDGTLNIIGI